MRRDSQSANPSVQLSHCDRCPNRCISVAQRGKCVHSGCLMIAAGLVASVLGVKAEQKSVEDIATPLTAEEADEEPGAETEAAGHDPGRSGPAPTPAGSDRRG